jgi:dihydropteroate synthase
VIFLTDFYRVKCKYKASMFTLNCNGRLLVAEQPLVMGIINLTPDSFFEDSRAEGTDAVLRHVEQMLQDGAAIIDIGAQSTRPGSKLLSDEEELSRIAAVIDVVTDKFPDAFFSVDTFYSRVAEVCISAGACMINDVSGGQMDAEMLQTAGRLNVPYVCMHMRGTPQNMHEHAHYTDVTREVLDYFIGRIPHCRNAGIKDIIADPGFGFSKNIHHNFHLLNRLEALKTLGLPLMVGLSRKSTVYKTLGVTAGEALNGTTVLHTIALLKGADILRVHDVKEARECVTLIQQLH